MLFWNTKDYASNIKIGFNTLPLTITPLIFWYILKWKQLKKTLCI